MRHATCVLLAFLGPAGLAHVPGQRNLTFEDRVTAQAAIERVYYGHQLETKVPFARAVPREVLEAKVQRALQQSAALERYWHTSVTDEMLERELARMAQGSRMPERLLELYAALDNDEVLVKECLARATLVDRLTRNFYDSDRELQATKAGWDAWWDEASRSLDPRSVPAVAQAVGGLPVPSAGHPFSGPACASDNTWDNGSLDDLPEGRTAHSAVWTGSVMVVWGGRTNNNAGGYGLNSGGRYDPTTDSWASTSMVGAPAVRSDHVAVWTGTQMLIWGGLGLTTYTDTGARYDPLTDTWTAMSGLNAPTARALHAAVWTGSEMITWGGEGGGLFPVVGGRYNPTTDTWTATSFAGAPAGRDWPTAVWTGTSMVVWGGAFWNGTSFTYLNTGGRYDPVSDTWTPSSLVNAPSPRNLHTAVWAGNTMIVWGGWNGGGAFNTGGRYDPATDTWTATSTTNAALARKSHAAVWTGSVMIVWGAAGNTGGRYDPVSNTWTATEVVNAAQARESPTMVWTGSLAIVWGGQLGSVRLDSGGRYNPSTDSWTATGTPVPIDARYNHSAIWTGSLMIVWGGRDASNIPLSTGARYDPATDTWSPIPTVFAPQSRWYHTAVWTGSAMVVWGGFDGSGVFNTGGRYDPLANTWSATATAGAPTARLSHTAVWTGDRMVVWGGTVTNGAGLNSGGRYDPVADAWTPTSTVNAPAVRLAHTAVWTGHSMVVWGGAHIGNSYNTGGRYDPASDLWTTISTVSAPSARYAQTAVWTGSVMVVWGGVSANNRTNTGGRYDPVADTWAATSVVSAPSARLAHVAVWTGNVMVVWGGDDSHFSKTGGRYDPVANVWTATASLSVPSTRWYHTAVWTGSAMIVWGGYTDQTTPVRSGGRYVLVPPVDADLDTYTVCGGDCNDAAVAIHPGATEVCNGIDDDCDQLTDEGIPAPSGVATILEAKSGTAAQLSWSAVPTATSYDVVTGDLMALLSGAGNFTGSTTSCLGEYATPTTVDDTAVPAPGEGVWHLVRAVNACGGNGSYDDGVPSQPAGRDAGINASSWACP